MTAPADVYVVRIDTDGTVTPCAGSDVLAIAAAGLADGPGYTGPSGFGTTNVVDGKGTDVVSVRWHPGAPLPTDGTTVLVVHDWGRLLGLTVNPKAWAMYGRSPLVGPVWVAADDGEPLDPDWIETVSRPLDEWMPQHFIDIMRDHAEVEGVTWP